MNVGSAAGVAAKQLVDGTAATVQDVDVSIVQKILNETFRQRIHGPPHTPPPKPPPPPPGPHRAWYVVSGAGAKEWNGAHAHSLTLTADAYRS